MWMWMWSSSSLDHRDKKQRMPLMEVVTILVKSVIFLSLWGKWKRKVALNERCGWRFSGMGVVGWMIMVGVDHDRSWDISKSSQNQQIILLSIPLRMNFSRDWRFVRMVGMIILWWSVWSYDRRYRDNIIGIICINIAVEGTSTIINALSWKEMLATLRIAHGFARFSSRDPPLEELQQNNNNTAVLFATISSVEHLRWSR